MLENLLTEDEFGKLIHKTKPTLQSWRSRRKGPPGVKVGKAIFYDRAKIERWLAAQERNPAAATS
jgi:hypothetical protein